MSSKMKIRKKTYISSNSTRNSESQYLPPELCTQILAKSPAKTVVRFRCVCKSWCDIIDNPDFVTQHRNLCKINSVNSKLLLALEGSGRYGMKGCSLTVRHADALRKTHHILKSTERYYLLGSCKELLLMLDQIDTRFRQKMMLWNPCIRKSLRIPPSPFSHRAVVYLFGFASCSKDYKVIETSFEQDGGSMSVAVYTLSDQQWSLRNDGLNMSFWYYVRLFWQNCSPKTGFIFQGAAHWISDDPNGDGNPADSSTHLVSLDFDLEKFTYLELPFASDDIGAVRFPFRLRESLAVFCISSEKSSIWELKEDTEKGVWTRRFSGLSSGDGFSLFSAAPRLPLFFYESDDGGWFVYGKKSYNIVSCQVHETGNKSVSRYVDMQMYREGLVLCKGYRAEDLESCS